MTNEKRDEEIKKHSIQGYVNSELDLGVSQTYDRNKYIDTRKMRENKQETFAGKKTAITYTGDVVHSSAEAVENKYGKNRASYHLSETDHTMPVKHVYDRHKNSAWLSDDDLKDVINAKSNLQEVSRHLNRSKKDLTNFQLIARDWQKLSKEEIYQLGKGQIKASTALETGIAMKKVKNISATAGEGAKNALIGASPDLLLKGVGNINKIVNGEMDGEEAIEDMAEVAGKVVVTGAAGYVAKGQLRSVKNTAKDISEKVLNTNLGQSVKKPITNAANNISKKILNRTVDSSMMGKAAGAVMALKDCALKFANGEIETGEFFIELMEDGAGYILGMVAYGVGDLFGGPVAAAFLSTVVNNIYDTVVRESRMYRKSKQELKEVKKVTEYILKKEKRYQDMLKDFRNTLEEKRGEAFDKLLVSIHKSVFQNDIDLFFKGINTFGESYGVHFQFETFQEFDDFMNDEEAVFQF